MSDTVICLDKICPPPPYVENGDYIIRDRDGKVITEIYYICQTNYVLNERKKYYKCEYGKWKWKLLQNVWTSHSFPNDFLESLPSCSVLNSVCNQLYFVSVKEPCAITLEILEAHNIKPVWEMDYLLNGDNHQVYCKSRWITGGIRQSHTLYHVLIGSYWTIWVHVFVHFYSQMN